MTGPSNTDRRGSGAPSDGIVGAVRRVIDQVRPPADDVERTREDRVDVRAAVLTELAERPTTGADIVRALQSRFGGERAPGAGAVYPMLQLLADEGLAEAEEADGRRRWSLTESGAAAAASARAPRAPEDRPARRTPVRRGGLARSTAQLVQTAALVGQTGTPDQVADAAAELDAARRRLLAILTRD